MIEPELPYSWKCPECDGIIHSITDRTGEVCGSCAGRPGWEALPASVREEVDRRMAEEHHLFAIKAIMEHLGSGLHEARTIHAYRYQNSRNSSGSIPRNAS